MNKKPFREHHLIQLLTAYGEQNLPLDLHVSYYFRDNKALGSNDRAELAELVYGIIRWKALLDFLSPGPFSWETRIDTFKRINPLDYLDKDDIPLNIRVSFPKVLFDLIVDSHGIDKATDLCLISNQQAPTTVRINPLKTSRDAMLKRWNQIYDISPCSFAPNGIVFHKKIAFFGLPEFKEGLFEVQDEGSQLLAELMQVKKGQQVMDYCSGSGGKTLAFAHRMGGTGQIYLHDIRERALQESRIRLRRAGIQNAQVVQSDDSKLKKLKKQMDWVLVDAPCTGTGTMRRNPDMKWNFDAETLERLIGQQRMIFEKALSYLKPEGKIVYATCSILKQENDFQLEHFKKTYQLECDGLPFQSLPSTGGMDGFYGVVLKRTIEKNKSLLYKQGDKLLEEISL